MPGAFNLSDEKKTTDVLQFLNEMTRRYDNNVGSGLPNGSLFTGDNDLLSSPIFGEFIGNDGFPTFDPASIQHTPTLSGLFESGAFDSMLTEHLAQNILDLKDPAKRQNLLTQANDHIVKNNAGERIGTINNDLISEALRNPPEPLGQDRPPIQTGPQTAPNPAPQPQATEPNAPATTRPDETGRVGDQFPTPTGDGQVPDAPSTPPIFGDGGFNFPDIFNIPGIFQPGGGGSVATPPIFPTGADNEGGFGLDDILGSIFGGGGSGGQGGSATASNVLTDLFELYTQGGSVGNTSATGGSVGNTTSTSQGGNATGGTGEANNSLSNILGDTITNLVFEDRSGDAYRDANSDALALQERIYNADVDRLAPFAELGVRNIPGLEAEANNNPAFRDLFSGQTDINPNTSFSVGGNALPNLNPQGVDVNRLNVFNSQDPALQFLQKEQRDSISNSALAQGKMFSGETAEALQDRAANVAANYASQLQGISSAQDQSNLLANSQLFGQNAGARSQLFGEDFNRAGFNLNQGQANIGNQFQKNNQLYDFLFNANSQDAANDADAFGQKNALVGGIGQPSAAGQASLGSGFSNAQTNLLQDRGVFNSNSKNNQNNIAKNALSRLF